jgi:hypothetical protein
MKQDNYDRTGVAVNAAPCHPTPALKPTTTPADATKSAPVQYAG